MFIQIELWFGMKQRQHFLSFHFISFPLLALQSLISACGDIIEIEITVGKLLKGDRAPISGAACRLCNWRSLGMSDWLQSAKPTKHFRYIANQVTVGISSSKCAA